MTNRLPLTSFSRLHDKRWIPPDAFRTNSRIPLGRAIVSALPFAICLILSAIPMRASDSLREVIDLNGVWMIAEGSMTKRPESFNHRVPVPGLVGMATPSFEFAGIELPQREAYWYRRTFRIDRELPATAWLKIHKARFGVRVWINDQDLGEYLPSFTPGWFDLRSAWRGILAFLPDQRRGAALQRAQLLAPGRHPPAHRWSHQRSLGRCRPSADRGPCLLKAELVRDEDPPVASRRMVQVH
jgi:hypothetical protein